jgi:hypothetical protein
METSKNSRHILIVCEGGSVAYGIFNLSTLWMWVLFSRSVPLILIKKLFRYLFISRLEGGGGFGGSEPL